MIEYRKGDCLQDTEEQRIIVHIVNDIGLFGKGFALSVAEKYPIVRDKYKHWHEASKRTPHHFHLGNIQPVIVNWNLTIINMLAQVGVYNKGNPVPLHYDALELCLKQVNYYNSENLPIWMPKIGSGLARGNWNTIEKMISKQLKYQNVVVFEL